MPISTARVVAAAVVSLACAPWIAASAESVKKTVDDAGVKALYASRGRSVWLRYCVVCHGVDAKGKTEWAKSVEPPPKDLTDPLNVTWAFQEDWLRLRIGSGIPGTAMPAFENVLSVAELTAVTQYVQQLSGSDKITEEQAKARQLERGKHVYRTRCAVCHGLDGNAGTAVAKAVEPPPRNLADPRAADWLTLDRIERVVTNGRPDTVMPAWGKVLSPAEIRAVASYVRTTLQKRID